MAAALEEKMGRGDVGDAVAADVEASEFRRARRGAAATTPRRGAREGGENAGAPSGARRKIASPRDRTPLHLCRGRRNEASSSSWFWPPPRGATEEKLGEGETGDGMTTPETTMLPSSSWVDEGAMERTSLLPAGEDATGEALAYAREGVETAGESAVAALPSA